MIDILLSYILKTKSRQKKFIVARKGAAVERCGAVEPSKMLKDMEIKDSKY
jgi:hypothetical protein